MLLHRKLTLGVQVVFWSSALQHRLQIENYVIYTESPFIGVEFLCLAASFLLFAGYLGAGLRAFARGEKRTARGHFAWALGLIASGLVVLFLDAPTLLWAA